jgi:hypothetical protein
MMKIFVFWITTCLMGIVCSSETVHKFIVLGSSFLGSDHVGWALKIEKIFSCLDGLQSVSDHDRRQVFSLLLIFFLDL